MFSLNGYWLREFVDGRIVILKVENDYDVYRYENGEWISTICSELGMSDEWEKISEEEAMSRLNILA